MHALLRDRSMPPTTCHQKRLHCTDRNPANCMGGQLSVARFSADTICIANLKQSTTIVAVAMLQQTQLPEVAVFWVAALRLLVLAFPFFTALSPGPREAEL
jgi:hypothetical protein